MYELADRPAAWPIRGFQLFVAQTTNEILEYVRSRCDHRYVLRALRTSERPVLELHRTDWIAQRIVTIHTIAYVVSGIPPGSCVILRECLSRSRTGMTV